MASVPQAVLDEFEASLDEYIDEWEAGIEEHVAELDEGQKSAIDSVLMAFGLKFNPNHDSRGRFATGPGGGSFRQLDYGDEDAIYAQMPKVTDLPLYEDPITRRLSGPRAEVLSYQGRSREINGHLRGSGPVGTPAYNADLAKKVVSIDAAFAGSALPENLKLYRGVPSTVFGKMKAGDVVIDKGFQSTTLMQTQGLGFSHIGSGPGNGSRQKFYALEIRAPKGMPAFAVDGGEREILLPRGVSLRLGRKRRVNATSYIIPAEVMSVGQ